MNNFEYSQKYFEAMQKLHGDGEHICHHPDCTKLCLGDYCLEHIERPATQPEDKKS